MASAPSPSPSPHLDAVLQLADVVPVSELEHLQLGLLLHVLDPLVGLAL